MSQKQLAESVGVTRQTIVSLEKNEHMPSLKLAYKISHVLKTPIEEIFQHTIIEKTGE
jgi:putative transcriptional regulator